MIWSLGNFRANSNLKQTPNKIDSRLDENLDLNRFNSIEAIDSH